MQQPFLGPAESAIAHAMFGLFTGWVIRAVVAGALRGWPGAGPPSFLWRHCCLVEPANQTLLTHRLKSEEYTHSLAPLQHTLLSHDVVVDYYRRYWGMMTVIYSCIPWICAWTWIGAQRHIFTKTTQCQNASLGVGLSYGQGRLHKTFFFISSK